MSVQRAIEQDDSAGLTALREHAATRPVAANITRALDALASRQRRDQFGAYEGILEGPAALSAVAERFGPDVSWSASQLESYATCPFRFFAERVLRLEELSDLDLRQDPRERGRMLHVALASAHRGLHERHGTNVSLAGPLAQEFIAGFRQQLDALLETVGRDDPLDRTLRRIDFELLHELVEQYVRQHAVYEKEQPFSLRPAHFEVTFGSSAGDPQADAQAVAPVLVVGSGAQAVRLTGRIDRIDVAGDGERTWFCVIDYKAGRGGQYRRPRGGEFDPTRMQLDLYAMAVEESLLKSVNASPWQAGYWLVESRGYKPWFATHKIQKDQLVEADKWELRKQELRKTIIAFVAAIRRGRFPVASADDHCTERCQLAKICRIGQVRALEKQWSP